jgi:hypothetical protein
MTNMTDREQRIIEQAHAAATISLYAHLKRNGWDEPILVKLMELMGMHKALMVEAAALVPEDAPQVPVHKGISA